MRQIIENYTKLLNSLEGDSSEVLYKALEPTFKLSQKYCPKDTGALVESGFLEQVGRGKVAKIAMGYAKGGDPEYAVFVHEFTHVRHEAPTRAKFLLTALEQDAQAIQQRIVRGYRDIMGVT